MLMVKNIFSKLFRLLGKRMMSNKDVSVAKKVVAGATKEPMFCGLTEIAINKLVEGVPRGVKAVIEGDKLKYFYKSSSGRTSKVAEFVVDKGGKLTAYLGNGSNYYSNSPRIFCERLINAIKH